MKYTFLFIFFLLFFSTDGNSQKLILETEININLSNVSILEVVNKINKQYKINFSYSSDWVSLQKKISINASKKSLDEVLREIFSKTRIRYEVVGNQIVLMKKKFLFF